MSAPGVPHSGEFYVGYQPAAPAGIARVARGAAIALLIGAAAVGAITTAMQDEPVASAWPGERVEMTGRLVAEPYPVLYVDRGADAEPTGVLLVAMGKFGLIDPGAYCGPEESTRRMLDAALMKQVEAIKAAAGERVRVSGTVLRREGRAAIEVAGDDAALTAMDGAGGAAALPRAEPLGRATLRGEIADPKCYFGAMKPGSGVTHRACAIRCVAGGITPVLIVRTPEGHWTYFVLTDTQGRPVNKQVLALVGRPVEVTGEAMRQGDVLTLAIDPATIRSLETRTGEIP